MFLRFVAPDPRDPSAPAVGVFRALYALERLGRLSVAECAWWHEEERWFNERLKPPQRFSRARRPGAARTAVSWVKASAKEHVRRLRSLAALLEEHGVPVTTLIEARPGYVVYEDDAQVLAEPFSDH